MFTQKLVGKILGFVFIFYLIFFASDSQAAVTINSVSSQGSFRTAAIDPQIITFTWMHNTNGGTNRALFVGISTASDPLLLPSAVGRVISVTYGGQSLTRVTNGFRASTDLENAVELFQMIAPPTGNSAIVVTLIPASVNYIVGGAVSFDGVTQTATPYGAFVSAVGNNGFPTVSVSDGVAGDLVLDVVANAPGGLTINLLNNSDQILRWEGKPFFSNTIDVGTGSTKTVPLGQNQTVTTNWQTTANTNWVIGALAVKQFVITAAAVTVSGRVLAAGKSVARARVIITDSNGVARATRTNFFGYYRFTEVTAGETYIMNVFSKQHSFNPQGITVNEDLTELNFVAQ